MADTVYISVVFTDEQEKATREAMSKFDLTWPDLVKIDNPDYHHWPYQVRLVFSRREHRGDDNYADWEAGDVFIDDDDPHGREFTATEVNGDLQVAHFTDSEEGEVLARFDRIRRVRRREG
jgi:hypothetical protein